MVNVQDLGGSSACKFGRDGFKVSKTQTLNPKLGSKFLRQVGVCLCFFLLLRNLN